MIGVTPLKTMSPLKQTRASGSQAIASPGVCAGPTSISSIVRPPASICSRPEKVRVGSRGSQAGEVVVGERLGEARDPAQARLARQQRHRGEGAGDRRQRCPSGSDIAGGSSSICATAASVATISAPPTRALPYQ